MKLFETNKTTSMAEAIANSRIKKTKISKLLRNRRVWIIHDLLDKHSRQIDIIKLWRRKGEIEYEKVERIVKNGLKIDTPEGIRLATVDDLKIFKPKKLKDGVGISKSEVQKILEGNIKEGYVGLKKEHIVELTFVEDKKGYKLIDDHDALLNILLAFNDPTLPQNFRDDMNKDLMNSKYAKKLINLDLVKKLKFSKYPPLNEKEMNFVLILIKISPSALLKFLKEIQYTGLVYAKFPNGEKIDLSSEGEKRLLLMNLQFLAYNDISRRGRLSEIDTFNPPYPVRVKFEIKTSLKTENEEFEHTSLLERSSFKLLSEKEQEEKTAETMEILKKLSSLPKIYPEIPNLLEKEDLGRSFDLGTSPLTYEEKDYD